MRHDCEGLAGHSRGVGPRDVRSTRCTEQTTLRDDTGLRVAALPRSIKYLRRLTDFFAG